MTSKTGIVGKVNRISRVLSEVNVIRFLLFHLLYVQPFLKSTWVLRNPFTRGRPFPVPLSSSNKTSLDLFSTKGPRSTGLCTARPVALGVNSLKGSYCYASLLPTQSRN